MPFNLQATLRTPWLKIATSLPVYATAVAHFCNNWGYYTLLTCLPSYLKYILKFDIKSVRKKLFHEGKLSQICASLQVCNIVQIL